MSESNKADNVKIVSKICKLNDSKINIQRSGNIPSSVLIIGSTNGIGLELATLYNTNGHDVVTSGRNQSKINKLNLPFFKVDLTDVDSIFNFCNRIKAHYRNNSKRIDTLILNAGIFSNKPVFQKNGLEITFMVNFFSYVLITLKLMDMINGEIIMISSPASIDKSICEDMISNTYNRYSFTESYGTSKLLLNVWANIVNKRYGIPCIAISPGTYIDTGMLHSDADSVYGIMRNMYHWFTPKITPTQSAELLYIYISKINRNWYGSYIQPIDDAKHDVKHGAKEYKIVFTDRYCTDTEINNTYMWIQSYSRLVNDDHNYKFPEYVDDPSEDTFSVCFYVCMFLCVLLLITYISDEKKN